MLINRELGLQHDESKKHLKKKSTFEILVLCIAMLVSITKTIYFQEKKPLKCQMYSLL